LLFKLRLLTAAEGAGLGDWQKTTLVKKSSQILMSRLTMTLRSEDPLSEDSAGRRLMILS